VHGRIALVLLGVIPVFVLGVMVANAFGWYR
jgi:hypothetical protein